VQRRAQVRDQLLEPAARIQAGRRGHEVGRPAAQPRLDRARLRPAVDRAPPALEADEAGDGGLVARHQALDAGDAARVLLPAQLGGARGRALDAVREADAALERADRIAFARDEPRARRSGPEAVARARERDAPLGAVERRIQPADEQPQTGPDQVGERGLAPGVDAQRRADPASRKRREPRAEQQLPRRFAFEAGELQT
jgi:hypothetical protein